MRAILLVVFTSVFTAVAALFLFHREELSEVGEQTANISGLPKTTPLSEVETRTDASAENLIPHPPLIPPLLSKERGAGGERSVYIAAADKYLDEALPLIEPKDRFVLIDKINGFRSNYELAVNSSGLAAPPAGGASLAQPTAGRDPDELKFAIRATARYIAAWSPFYYYIHPDARAVLGPVIKMLERERAEMQSDLAKQDARMAGRLAAEDIEYYIEDIRKSAARRNSDFITFSLQDYEEYRKVFDELVKSHNEFLFGFAESAHILFDDFYRMREEVDTDYLDKTRKKVEDVRLELRALHKSARQPLGATILAIEHELAAHPDWRAEIHDIMKSDYDFYKNTNF
jgi:hypothetical protein